MSVHSYQHVGQPERTFAAMGAVSAGIILRCTKLEHQFDSARSRSSAPATASRQISVVSVSCAAAKWKHSTWPHRAFAFSSQSRGPIAPCSRNNRYGHYRNWQGSWLNCVQSWAVCWFGVGRIGNPAGWLASICYGPRLMRKARGSQGRLKNQDGKRNIKLDLKCIPSKACFQARDGSNSSRGLLLF